ncbi:hypothetical protein LAZ40_21770 [Cereibacter sphaeroides]|uniref:hypothetical protein n=1 Tax=Cereibacter sphaeroides TaxID=1063 RepID=UPI001F3329C9|nr:hypothetical protein [Cereibacter sphaeroides]MCE6961664.1 hypothetical protein [Cereibacter sphaeroides]MCE6968074.1 hypothetical protein [Cereibacter sphaeroides]MCE6975014.1 hypothetical protein [Cereibacter sphaeroides]
MSASENNLEKQKRRHRGPLIGIIVVVVFALGLLLWWVTYEVAEGEAPRGSGAQVDGRTGEIEDRSQSGSVEGTSPAGAANSPAPPATAPATPAPAN